MIVVDTTVLIYAVGDHHEFRDPCRALVAAIQRGDLTATTTIEVIQEFTHVRARRRTREDAVRLSEAYVTMLSPLLAVEEADLRTGLALFQRHPELGSFDAVLAAATRSIDADALVSTDAGFSVAEGFRHVVPDADGIRRLLGTSDPDEQGSPASSA